MNIVLHVCCAPCLAGTLDAFTGRGDVLSYFYNPNIHPLLEFRKRLKALDVYADREHLSVEADRSYGLVRFLELVGPRGAGRCPACYRERLGRTARFAADHGADAFSTTLLASTHQKHDAVRAAGEQAAADTGVRFLYQDLRGRAERGREIARKLSLYRQQYCGCVFSEYERYKDTNVEVYRGRRQG